MIRLELSAARIYVRPGATDLRKQINGLVLLVKDMPDAPSVVEQRDRLRVENQRLVLEKDELVVRNDQLVTRNSALVTRNSDLATRNGDLVTRTSALDHQVQQLDHQVQELDKKISLYEEELAWYRHRRYGRSSEQLSAAEQQQIQLFNEIERSADGDLPVAPLLDKTPAEPAAAPAPRSARRPRRQPLPPSLPRVERVVDLELSRFGGQVTSEARNPIAAETVLAMGLARQADRADRHAAASAASASKATGDR